MIVLFAAQFCDVSVVILFLLLFLVSLSFPLTLSATVASFHAPNSKFTIIIWENGKTKKQRCFHLAFSLSTLNMKTELSSVFDLRGD